MTSKDKVQVLPEEEQHESSIGFLLDSTYPLLQHFREKCPGTYKHAQGVVSMVETISLELGLDVNFMKVCALYHDIGKTVNPEFFTENQMEDENPHDKMEPWVSYQIISRHVADTVNILINNPDFSRDIITVVSQHHGNGVIKYFCDKAKAKDEDEWRYDCARPTGVESAVLMIADHVEARSRSKFQSGHFDPADVIESTITELLDDGQLDDVVMKLGDLKKIKEAIAKELEGSYQKRVDYDKVKEEDANGDVQDT